MHLQMSRKKIISGAAAIIFLTLAVYIPAMQGGFIWDDDYYVTQNLTLRSLNGLKQIWWEIGATPQYYPLVHTTFWIEYHLWELHPLGYHLDNVMLHVLNALFLWRLLLRLKVPAAWPVAAVFALHPVHVESVAWITERKNLLSGFFYLLAVLSYFHFFSLNGGFGSESSRADAKSSQAQASGRPLPFYLLSIIFFLCALLSKTVTCSMPAVILLLIWWKKRNIEWRDILLTIPLFVIGALFGLLTVWMEKYRVGAMGEEWSLTFLERCLVAGRALWFYAEKLIWPQNLAFIYPQWTIDAGIWWQHLYPLTALSVVIAGWFARKRLGKAPLAAVLFFAGTLVPALGFFDVYPHRYSYVADHFQYLASIGIISLVVSGTAKVLEGYEIGRKYLGRVLCLTVLTGLAAQTWDQGKIYRDRETLWRDTIAKNPKAWMSYNNLGNVLSEQGKYQEAIACYMEVRKLKPDYVNANWNLGIALARLGKFHEAIRHYMIALRTKPDKADVHYNLGLAFHHLGQNREAIDHFRQALLINPRDAEAHNDLGNTLALIGKPVEAISHYKQALRIKPGLSLARFRLAVAYLNLDDKTSALQEQKRLKKLNGSQAELLLEKIKKHPSDHIPLTP